MRDTNIRAVTKNDLNVLYGLFAEIQSLHAKNHPEYFKEPQNDSIFEEFFTNIIDDTKQFLDFICVDKIPQGYIHFQICNQRESIFSHSRKHAYIHQIIITQNFRKSGCATALINHVRAQVSKLDIKEIGVDHCNNETSF